MPLQKNRFYLEEVDKAISIAINDIKYTDDIKKFKISKLVTIHWDKVLASPPKNNSETTKKELEYLSGLTKSVTSKDLDLIYAVDKDSKFLYIDVLDRLNLDFPHEDFKRVWNIVSPVIQNIKYIYNRPRPIQLAQIYNISLKEIKTPSITTPAYPSGHSSYAAVAAYILAAKYPEHSGKFFDKVGIVSKARMMQGVHYPSDTEASMIITGAIWENIRYKLFPNYNQF